MDAVQQSDELFSEKETAVRLNLSDLRSQVTLRLALLAITVAQFCILLYEAPTTFPLEMLFFWLLLTGVGVTALALADRRATLSRHVLVWGLTAVLLLGMVLFPVSWLPFLAVLIIFCGALLVRGSEFVAGLLPAAAAFWLNHQGVRAYPLTGVLTNLLLAMIIAWLTVRTLYTVLDWLWRTHQKAERLLQTTRDQQGELKSVVKSLQTTNALRIQAERDLMVAHKQAREAQRLKEQFAANISHELRTPLSIILGFSEVMYLSPEVYGDVALSPKLYRDVGQIYRNSRHLMGMIDDILDLSHFEMTGFTLHREPTDVGPLLRETVELVADLFRARSVALRVEIAPDLPRLEIDRTRIRQVLLNLLNNARRFTEAGEVVVTARQTADNVEVRVRDTGPGIPPQQLERIFTEFYQVDYSLSRQHGGAGLGLAICQRFVQAHNGRIWAESELGNGSTFIFTLPLQPPLQGAPFHARTLEPPPEKALPRLLVVDPDPAVAGMVQRHLEGYEVIGVQYADQVAAEVAVHHPAGVLWNTPPGDTPPAASLPDLPAPIIVCSLPSQAWMAHTLGAVACLNKPLDFDRLQQVIVEIGDVQSVLVVDDNAGVCQLVERRLAAGERPCTVQMAYDGENGLAAMRRRQPDLLLLDLIMPGLDGFQVLAEMRADPALASIPVVLLTATDFAAEQLAHHGGGLSVYHRRALRPVDVLRCVPPLLQALPARYDELLLPLLEPAQNGSQIVRET